MLSTEKQSKGAKSPLNSSQPLIKVNTKARSQSEHTFDILPDEEFNTLKSPLTSNLKRTSFQESVTILTPPHSPKDKITISINDTPIEESKQEQEEEVEKGISLRSKPKAKKKANLSFIHEALEYLKKQEGIIWHLLKKSDKKNN